MCTTARYIVIGISSKVTGEAPINQASSFNACNVGASFIASNCKAITRLGFIQNLPKNGSDKLFTVFPCKMFFK